MKRIPSLLITAVFLCVSSKGHSATSSKGLSYNPSQTPQSKIAGTPTTTRSAGLGNSTEEKIDFAARLTNSFNNTPLARTNVRMVTIMPGKESDFEAKEEARRLRCRTNSPECEQEAEENIRAHQKFLKFSVVDEATPTKDAHK